METKDILRNRRIELNLTMKQVADAVGVSEATVSRWESGDIDNMRRDKIAALAKALDLDPRIIMGWEGGEKIAQQKYYTDSETAQIAQKIFDDPELHALFDAARDSKPESLKAAAAMLKALKGTNPDG